MTTAFMWVMDKSGTHAYMFVVERTVLRVDVADGVHSVHWVARDKTADIAQRTAVRWTGMAEREGFGLVAGRVAATTVEVDPLALYKDAMASLTKPVGPLVGGLFQTGWVVVP